MTVSLDLNSITLSRGTHHADSGQGCLLEWTSREAGEEWTDHPHCVSPAIAAFGRSWNDALADAGDITNLERLKRYIPRLIGTAGSPEQEEQISWMATDWLARVLAPAFLRLAGLETFATTLEVCQPLTSDETAAAAQPSLSAALSAARSAADAAARSAALSAALSAARSAARSAADSAAYSAARSAAYSAARSAAYSAARSAAYSAARSAAQEAFAPVVKRLQESAFALLDAMIAVTAQLDTSMVAQIEGDLV